jgi:hypothetical protein
MQERNETSEPVIEVWENEGGLIEKDADDDGRHGRRMPEWNSNPFRCGDASRSASQ